MYVVKWRDLIFQLKITENFNIEKLNSLLDKDLISGQSFAVYNNWYFSDTTVVLIEFFNQFLSFFRLIYLKV